MPEKPMVENISWILPATDSLGGLLLGNVYGAQDPAVLKEYGVRAVLTLALESLPTYSPIDIPMHLDFAAHDKEDYVVTQHIGDCIDFIEESRGYTNVYVHCYAGVSRSAAIICGYLMWKYDWDLQKTMAFVVFKRIVAKPNDGFMRQLKEYQEELKSKKGVFEKNTPMGANMRDRASNASNLLQKSNGIASSLMPNIPRGPSKLNTSILNYDPNKSLKQPTNLTSQINSVQNRIYTAMPLERRNTLIGTQKEEMRETMEGNRDSIYNGAEEMRHGRANTRSLNQVKNQSFLSPREEMNQRNARGGNQFWDPKTNDPLASYYRQIQNPIRTTAAFDSLYNIPEHVQKGKAEINNAKSTLTYKHSDTPIPKLLSTKAVLAQQQKKSRNMLTSHGFQTGSPSTNLPTASNLYTPSNSSSVPDLNPIANMYMSNLRNKIPRVSGKEDSKFKRYEQQKNPSLKAYESIETSKKDRNSSRINLMPKDLPGYKK